jgi:hypothetical protein
MPTAASWPSVPHTGQIAVVTDSKNYRLKTLDLKKIDSVPRPKVSFLVPSPSTGRIREGWAPKQDRD